MNRGGSLSLRLFGVTMWKLFIIKPFFQSKLNEIEIETHIGVWGHSSCCCKAFNKLDLVNFISQFLELKCGRYWFLNKFCCHKFKKIAKIGFGRKTQLSIQCVHITIFKFSNFENVKKKKNFHTWANNTCYTSNL